MAAKPDDYSAPFPPTGAHQTPYGQHGVSSSHHQSFPPQYDYTQSSATAPPSPDPTPESMETFQMTPHVQIAFEETFKESSSARGFPFMTKVNSAIFKYTLFGFYATISLIIGPILAFAWALAFALLQLIIVWFVQPFIKIIFVTFRISSLLYEASIRIFLDPVFRSMSLALSRIRGRFGLDDTNMNLNMKTSQIQNA